MDKKRWLVNVHYDMVHQMVILAETPEEAEKLARELFSSDVYFSDDSMEGITEANCLWEYDGPEMSVNERKSL